MLAIFITACMISDPNVCKEYKINLSDEVTDTTHCAMSAAPHLAPWTEEHPGWQIKRWRCGAGSEDKI